MKRTAFRLLVASSLLLAVTAMAGTRPRYGGALRIEISGSGWEDDGIARKLVGETLTAIDDEGQVQPALAQRWEAQSGGRRWQFWLRPGVKFHDGSVLTAAVVAQTLSASSRRHRYLRIRHADAAASGTTRDVSFRGNQGRR